MRTQFALEHLEAARAELDEKIAPRNAECPCKSGLEYKRCCGKSAAAVLNVTRKAA
jgi:uncharacterized protein YecA (UPF0149 family)